jgi:7-cyano-7-deazaguanine synthase in queuosine biosynthesis
LKRAKLVEYLGVEPNRGRCPWRLRYLIDKHPLDAFFRPPGDDGSVENERHAFLVGLAVFCDLAAEFRPDRAVVRAGETPRAYSTVFRDAVTALIAEQDAFWGRKTPVIPALEFNAAKVASGGPPLDPRRVVLAFSGGKDSVLSLFALLESGVQIFPVLLNEGDRTWQDLRKWIPKLAGLGLEPRVAYLKAGRSKQLKSVYGDRYYTSYQLGMLTAVLCGFAVNVRARAVALGIESSPEQAWIRVNGRRVNHQHQKTRFHLERLERLWQQSMHAGLRIASPIADLSDSQVMRALLNRVPGAYRHFSSCGASSYRSKHCGECEKCAFVYLLLMQSTEGRRLAKKLFRSDLLEDVELYRPWIDARYKPPLACVGPPEEVWSTLENLLQSGFNRAAVAAWSGSSIRTRFLSRRGCELKSGRNERSTWLNEPVREAASLAREWTS